MNKLRAYRVRQGLTIRALADAADVPYSTVTMIERGERDNPSIAIVTRLCAVLHADPRRVFPAPTLTRKRLDTSVSLV